MPDPARENLFCKECRYWYGAEDDEYGPCQIKHARGDAKFITYGGHPCDEPQALREYGVERPPRPTSPDAPDERGRPSK